MATTLRVANVHVFCGPAALRDKEAIEGAEDATEDVEEIEEIEEIEECIPGAKCARVPYRPCGVPRSSLSQSVVGLRAQLCAFLSLFLTMASASPLAPPCES